MNDHDSQRLAEADDQRFRSLADTAPAVLWVADADGRCSFLSRGWYDFTGQTEATGLDSGWLDAIHPDDRAAVQARFAAATRAREPLTLEYRLRRADGEYRFALDSGRPRLGSAGELLGYVGSVIDITDRKRSERLEEEQRQILELVALGCPLGESLGELTEAIARLAPGVRAGVLTVSEDGATVADVFATGFPAAFCAAVRGAAIDESAMGTCGTAIRTATPVACTDTAHARRWSAAWQALCREHGIHACYSTPVIGSGGRPIASLFLSFPEARAATSWEHRIAELGADVAGLALEHERTTAALRASEGRFRLAMDAAEALVYDIDVAGGLAAAEVHGLAHIVGEEGRDARVTREWWGARIHPDDLDEHAARVSRALDDASSAGYRSEYRVRHTDGFWRTVDDRARIQRDGAGRAERIIGTIFDVTERKQVEGEARREHEHLELLSDTVPALISYVGPDRCYRACNAEYSKWFGLRREQIVGRSIKEVVGLAAYAVVVPHVEKAFAGEMSEFEAEVDYRYGGRRWIHARYTPHRDAAGAVIGVVIFVTDITNRKQSEHARARLAAIVDTSEDAIISKSLNGIIMSWNRSASRLFGYSAEEAIGKPITMLFPAERLDEETNILARIRSGASVPPYETVRRRKDGSLIDVSLTVSPIIEAGSIVGASKIARDITARKQAEERVRQSRQALYDLVERAPFGVYIVDSALRITQMNRGSQTGAFRNVQPAIGRDLVEAMRIIWPEHVADEVVAAFRRTLATGESYFSRDFTQTRGDIDAVESYEWELHRIRLPDEEFGVACYYFDSTRLRQAEQALREADKRKDEFLATLAHELRNPLAPIRNGMQILRLTGAEPQSARQVHEMIERQLSHLVRLVDDLMEVARVTRGKIELRREPIDLATVIGNAIDTARPLIEAARHELAVDIGSAPLTVMADPVRIAQVIANLLNNAAKYTEEGGRIAVRLRREGASALVSVSDNGVGISADMLSNVFDLFAQGNRTYQRAQGGLGIGLTLVRTLVELHGGSVVAKSEGLGKGSEFIVRLPLGLELPSTSEPSRDERVGELAQHRILVVDDSRDAAESLATLLGFLGADVEVAGDGPAALDALESYRPSVVLLDIGMPGMDGFEVARRARRRPSGRDATLIALSGWGQDEDRRRSKDAGIDYHFVKPVDVDALTRLLAALARSGRLLGPGSDSAVTRPH